MSKQIVLGTTDATLREALGWRRAFDDATPTISQSFLASKAFAVTGVLIAENAAVLEVGLDMLIATETTHGIAYTGQFGDNATQNGLNASLKVDF